MQDFQFQSPTAIFFGPGNASAFAAAVAGVSQKLLVVCGGGSVERLGYLSVCERALQEAGCRLHRFDGIEPNPDASSINAAAKLGAQQEVDGVIAVGGGSAMDAAKAIAALIASKESDIWPFVAGQPRCQELSAALPVFTVPTTAATASEVTPFAVISNRSAQGKAPIAYDFLKPRMSWLNPEFTTELPAHVTQDGAADILSHVFENYIIGGNEALLTDRYCEAIIKTVVETLPALLQEPKDLALRAELQWCATLALNGRQLAGRKPGGFPLHAIEHAMSALVPELAHGRGLATLFPAYFRWLWQADRAKERLHRLGVEVFDLAAEDETTGLAFIASFEAWLADNDLLQSATSLGLGPEQFSRVAQGAIATAGTDGALSVLGKMTEADIVNLLELTETQS